MTGSNVTHAGRRLTTRESSVSLSIHLDSHRALIRQAVTAELLPTEYLSCDWDALVSSSLSSSYCPQRDLADIHSVLIAASTKLLLGFSRSLNCLHDIYQAFCREGRLPPRDRYYTRVLKSKIDNKHTQSFVSPFNHVHTSPFL